MKNDNPPVRPMKKLVEWPASPAGASCCGTSSGLSDCCGSPLDLGQTIADLSPAEVHQGVRERYGQIARTGDATEEAASFGCCGPKLYPADQWASLPASVAELSLGCGDPVSEGDIREGDTVLDLGSGGGIDCFLAAKRVGAAGHVIGIDMTPEMLERARASAARMKATQVEFRQGQIEALPVADGEVDVVISNCVINLSPDKPRVFREMFRALKPGGRVSVSDIVTNGSMSPLISQDMQSWAECVAGASPAETYRNELEAAGFTDIQVKPKEGAFGAIQAGMPFSALISARKP